MDITSAHRYPENNVIWVHHEIHLLAKTVYIYKHESIDIKDSASLIFISKKETHGCLREHENTMVIIYALNENGMEKLFEAYSFSRQKVD